MQLAVGSPNAATNEEKSERRAAADPTCGVNLEFIDDEMAAEERSKKMLLRSGKVVGDITATCANCKVRPVSVITNCFPDWCLRCDSTLWATRDDDG